MARPKSFDENQVLDAAIDCFRRQGLKDASIRDLAGEMGIAGPSLYNAFGCKRELFLQALDRYVECTMRSHFAELEERGPKAAILAFFSEFVEQALAGADQRGCLLVNTAMEVAPQDAELAARVGVYLDELQGFLHRNLTAARTAGEIPAERDPAEFAGLLLAVLLGIGVRARTQAARFQLESMVRPVLALLDLPSKP